MCHREDIGEDAGQVGQEGGAGYADKVRRQDRKVGQLEHAWKYSAQVEAKERGAGTDEDAESGQPDDELMGWPKGGREDNREASG